MEWLRGLDFGFVEFDCLLIHGNTVSVSEALTPDTSSWIILDRLNHVNINYLFCGRSSQMFNYELQSGLIESSITILDKKSISEVTEVKKKWLIGFGNIGKTANTASYTFYNPFIILTIINLNLERLIINYQNCR